MVCHLRFSSFIIATSFAVISEGGCCLVMILGDADRMIAKDNTEKAQMSFTDVVTRTITINEIIHKPAMLSMFGPGLSDFGEDVRTKSMAVQDAIMSLPE